MRGAPAEPGGQLAQVAADGVGGNGGTANTNTPAQVTGLGWVATLGHGRHHTLEVKQDGTVWAWGSNSGGQLGNGTTTRSLTPIQVPGVGSFVAVTGGEEFTLALRADGTVWAWGWNGNGQLGQGDTSQRLSPVQVKGASGQGFLTGVVGIAGGAYHGLALKNDGTVWAWGFNTNGRLGDGTTTDRWTPVQVVGAGGAGTLGDITALAAGRYHSLAQRRDGTVWTWGYNGDGQLGDGTTTTRLFPGQVTGLSSVTTLAGGDAHNLATKSTVWGWGYNGNGELGDGTRTTPRTTPVQAAGVTGVTHVSAGSDFGQVLKSDGSVWGWGWNGDGQLGDGTYTTPRLAPVRAIGLGVMNLAVAGAWHGLAATTSHLVSTTYGYDHLYRLTGVTAPNGPTSYGYDAAGNRLSRTRAGATQSWSYDSADRFRLSTGAHVDNNGNVTIMPGSVYAYDTANRLTQATGGGYVIGYSYDGDGRRTRLGKSVVGGGGVYDVSYVDDVGRGLATVLEERRAGVNVPTETRKYVWGAGGLVYVASSLGTVDVYHSDGLGSVRALSDSTAQVVETYQTDEYGVPTATAGSRRQPFQYTGEERDENGLVFLRARTYDPNSRRFLQRDPLPKSGPGIAGWNRYSYVGNNPVSRSDPSGLCSDPGGPGIRYCVERFIPTATVSLLGLTFLGDNRGASADSGEAYRVHQQIYQSEDGTTTSSSIQGVTYAADATTAAVLGREEGRGYSRGCFAAKSRILDGGRRFLAVCGGSIGLAPEGGAPPIITALEISESVTGAAQVTSARGTPYPSLEVWQYSDAGANLVYGFDATRQGTNALDLLFHNDEDLLGLQP